MNVNSMKDLMRFVKGLSNEEQMGLVQQIVNLMNETPDSRKMSLSASCNDLCLENNSDRPDCPHCQAKASLGYIIRKGHKRGVQRFFCKNCERYFVATTQTAFSRTRKDSETWKKFIHLTITGASLKKSAAACGICYQTAFTWRHKIMNVFRVNQNTARMSGEIQIDEMLIPISYKGNRIKGAIGTRRIRENGAPNGLPRKSFKRGSDNKSLSSKDKVCVFCMVEERNKSFFGVVPGTGFMDFNMLDNTLGKHVIKENSLILADQYRITANYLEANNYNHMILLSNTSSKSSEHKPEVREGRHIQHVNNLHAHLRNFLKKYYGVSSKYLDNYVSMFIWLKNVHANKMDKKLQKVSTTRASAPDCYITGRAIRQRPIVPICA